MLTTVALVLALVASSAHSAGPGACMAQCNANYYICLSTHGGGHPDTHGGAVAFCLNELGMHLNFCNQVIVLYSTFGFAFVSNLNDGGGGGLPDKVESVVGLSLHRTHKLLDRAFAKTLRNFERGHEKMQEALALARVAPASPADLQLIADSVTGGQALLVGLEDIGLRECHMAVDLGITPGPPDLGAPFVLSGITNRPFLRSEDLQEPPGKDLGRALDKAAKLYDRGDAKYAKLHGKVIAKLERLSFEMSRFAEKGLLAAQVGTQAVSGLMAAIESLEQERALRACFETR